MQTLFQAAVTNIGEMVPSLLCENVLIMFDQKAPKELHDIAVLHEGGSLQADIEVGDTLEIAGEQFAIIFVGDKVNSAVRELGHVSIKFGGSKEDLPGSICVDAVELPQVAPGSIVRIVRKP